MAQFNVKTVHFHYDANPEAETKLLSVFSPERVEHILCLLNKGEQKILIECWDQLQKDLRRHQEPSTISIPMFMFHFHNYAS